MGTGAIAAVVVAVVLVVALGAALLLAGRRRKLRRQFGPEYDRVASERNSRLAADAELAQRERRVHQLKIRPLSEGARRDYANRWDAIQEEFVDSPQEAVTNAQALVTAVMNERGYPTDDHAQVVADLSVGHANTVDHFRAADEISQRAASGTASTEDLRQAMIHCRELFADLLSAPSDEQVGRAGMSADQPAADSGLPDQAVPEVEAEAGPDEPVTTTTPDSSTLGR